VALPSCAPTPGSAASTGPSCIAVCLHFEANFLLKVLLLPCFASICCYTVQGRSGFAKLRAHPWFRSINWTDLQDGRSMLYRTFCSAHTQPTCCALTRAAANRCCCYLLLPSLSFSLQGCGGFAKLRSHPWFRSINWTDLQCAVCTAVGDKLYTHFLAASCTAVLCRAVAGLPSCGPTPGSAASTGLICRKAAVCSAKRLLCPHATHVLRTHACCCYALPLSSRSSVVQGRGGFAKLRAHPWFRSINWTDLQEGCSMLCKSLCSADMKPACCILMCAGFLPSAAAAITVLCCCAGPRWLCQASLTPLVPQHQLERSARGPQHGTARLERAAVPLGWWGRARVLDTTTTQRWRAKP
jgi:hypothetical protein